MPSIPNVKELNANTVQILNAIRNGASESYRSAVPTADGTNDNIRTIGDIVNFSTDFQNEFVSALINRIGCVIVTSKMYSNPWAMFKRGIMEYGETIEEIFVNIAKPFSYNPATAENTVFRREIPDVRSAFHMVNYKKFYKDTIQNEDLRMAFLSMDGVTGLIARIVDSMYTGANYDEYVTMKYMLARHILNGQFEPVQVPSVSSANMKTIASTIKTTSNDLTFLSPNYNYSGVQNETPKTDQYIIMTTAFDAVMDVEVLAEAFNMDRADFVGRKVLVDGFGNLDTARLAQLFADDPNYTPLTSAELTALATIPAVLVDREFFMIFDNLMKFTEIYNAEGLYWNYFYHAWKTFSVSPFANAVVFVPGAPSVTSVVVSPATATITAGASVQFSAAVVAANFADKRVTWSAVLTISGESVDLEDYTGDITLTQNGLLTVGASVDDVTAITVKATSNFDTTTYGTATVTISR